VNVGHQAYPHKILTGRRDKIGTIRQKGGLHPFPWRGESEYDVLSVGHSSTSISAGIGIAVAAEKENKQRRTVCVIGDGAITAGMAFEAMNHAGDIKPDMLVVLNDNEMSISENVGALNNHLAQLLSGKLYSTLREGGKKVFSGVPPIKELLKRTEEHIKGMVVPGTLFEELGFNYIGPVDGHDVLGLVNTLKNMRDLKGPLDSFRLEPDTATQNLRAPQDKESADSVGISFNGSKIEITSSLNSTGMRLVWQVPFGTLLLDTLQNILLPLLLNIGLLALALFGYSTFRTLPGRQSDVPATTGTSNELRVLRALNEEIVSVLPLGLLVHDQEANRTIISNKIADHLLPHLNLQNITTMADQHQGVIQATINNELYEIRQFRSQVASRTQIFIIRDQDREVLVNKKLKQAQRLYEKNQQGRAAFMQNIGEAFKQPLKALATDAAHLNSTDSHQIARHADTLVRLALPLWLSKNGGSPERTRQAPPGGQRSLI
jgi:hypothetical protein